MQGRIYGLFGKAHGQKLFFLFWQIDLRFWPLLGPCDEPSRQIWSFFSIKGYGCAWRLLLHTFNIHPICHFHCYIAMVGIIYSLNNILTLNPFNFIIEKIGVKELAHNVKISTPIIRLSLNFINRLAQNQYFSWTIIIRIWI